MVSSRSHLYIQVEFKNGGKLTIVDMAGAENTIQIQCTFLIAEDVTLQGGDKLKISPIITQKNDSNKKLIPRYLMQRSYI